MMLAACSEVEAEPESEPGHGRPATSAPTREPTPTLVGKPTPPRTPPPRATPSGPVVGADISWPQCPVGMGIPERLGEGQPMPARSARFVVIGLTNGPAFFPNPCIDSQVEFARARHLPVAAYAVANYPSEERLQEYGDQGPYDAATSAGRLLNTGYAQARFNLDTMERVGFESPVIWVDVEPYPLFPWSDDVRANTAVVEGILRGYTEAGYRVGFYSAPGLWRQVLGEQQWGHPEWRTAGRLTQRDALARCNDEHSFQGGDAVMGQWYTDRNDYDVLCPGVRMADWFLALP